MRKSISISIAAIVVAGSLPLVSLAGWCQPSTSSNRKPGGGAAPSAPPNKADRANSSARPTQNPNSNSGSSGSGSGAVTGNFNLNPVVQSNSAIGTSGGAARSVPAGANSGAQFGGSGTGGNVINGSPAGQFASQIKGVPGNIGRNEQVGAGALQNSINDQKAGGGLDSRDVANFSTRFPDVIPEGTPNPGEGAALGRDLPPEPTFGSEGNDVGNSADNAGRDVARAPNQNTEEAQQNRASSGDTGGDSGSKNSANQSSVSGGNSIVDTPGGRGGKGGPIGSANVQVDLNAGGDTAGSGVVRSAKPGDRNDSGGRLGAQKGVDQEPSDVRRRATSKVGVQNRGATGAAVRNPGAGAINPNLKPRDGYINAYGVDANPSDIRTPATSKLGVQGSASGVNSNINSNIGGNINANIGGSLGNSINQGVGAGSKLDIGRGALGNTSVGQINNQLNQIENAASSAVTDNNSIGGASHAGGFDSSRASGANNRQGAGNRPQDGPSGTGPSGGGDFDSNSVNPGGQGQNVGPGNSIDNGAGNQGGLDSLPSGQQDATLQESADAVGGGEPTSGSSSGGSASDGSSSRTEPAGSGDHSSTGGHAEGGGSGSGDSGGSSGGSTGHETGHDGGKKGDGGSGIFDDPTRGGPGIKAGNRAGNAAGGAAAEAVNQNIGNQINEGLGNSNVLQNGIGNSLQNAAGRLNNLNNLGGNTIEGANLLSLPGGGAQAGGREAGGRPFGGGSPFAPGGKFSGGSAGTGVITFPGSGNRITPGAAGLIKPSGVFIEQGIKTGAGVALPGRSGNSGLPGATIQRLPGTTGGIGGVGGGAVINRIPAGGVGGFSGVRPNLPNLGAPAGGLKIPSITGGSTPRGSGGPRPGAVPSAGAGRGGTGGAQRPSGLTLPTRK